MNRVLRHFAFPMFLTLALLAGPARADAPACPPAPAPIDAAAAAEIARDAPDRGLLWRIQKDGRTSWLYGTIHVGRRAWTAPGPVVRDALRASDVLAVELDPTDPATTTRLLQGMARNPALALTADQDRRLAAQLVAACLPVALAERVAPEFLGATLLLSAARPGGFEAEYGVDMTLIRTARTLGKTVQALETVDIQLAGLLSDNEADLQSGMTATLDALEAGHVAPMLARLAEAWEQGRADELANYTDWCDCVDTPAERARLERLLDGRNPGLADGIAQRHAAGRRVFAAVGSLHLVGPTGLPALFAARGYTVTRVPLPR